MPPEWKRLAVSWGLPAIAAVALVGVAATWVADGRAAARRDDAASPVSPVTRVSSTPSARLAETESAPDSIAAAPSSVAELQQRNRELEASLQTAKANYESLASWVLQHVRGRFPLKMRHVANLRFAPLGADGSLNADLADFLNVESRDRDLVTDALAFGRDSLHSIESQLMTSTQTAPDRVAIHIPPYPEEGAAVRNDLMLALEAALGRGKFDRFLDVAAVEMDRQFEHFGAASRTIVFQLVGSPDPQDPPFLVIRDGRIIPKGQGQRSVEMAESSVRVLPIDYVRFLDWLPDFVAAYAPAP